MCLVCEGLFLGFEKCVFVECACRVVMCVLCVVSVCVLYCNLLPQKIGPRGRSSFADAAPGRGQYSKYVKYVKYCKVGGSKICKNSENPHGIRIRV